MAYNTNIDPLDFPGSGWQIASGTNRRKVLRDFANHLKTFGSGRWDEVTGSSPTPTALQTYASTIPDPADETSTYGASEHVTLYDTTDPALSLGTPTARLLRLTMGLYGIVVGVLDPVLSTPTWAWHQPAAGTQSLTQNSAQYYGIGNHSDEDSVINVTGWNMDMTVHLFEDDNWLMAQPYLKSGTFPLGWSGFAVYLPDEPTDGSQTRESIPHIYHLNASQNFAYSSDVIEFAQPGGTGFTAGNTQVAQDWQSLSVDNQGRYPLVPIHLFHSAENFNPADGWLANLWVGTKTAIPETDDYVVLTINATDYVAFRNHSTFASNDEVVAVPAANIV